MRTMTLSNGVEYGTNNTDGGIFVRKSDGTWSQWAGNAQTPQFKTPQQMRAYLRRHFDIRNTHIVATNWS